MSRFKFKEWLFKNFFPYYYKENDTYKDEQGKGILERFVEVCSEYFDDNVTPDIDKLLDQIDPDTAEGIFLNYIWEYFSYLPFAWGVLIGNEEDWKLFGKDQISRWMNTIKNFPKADARKMLKYAISLYKIRGTEAFYQILGRFYNVQFTITQVSCTECSPNPNDHTVLWKATYRDSEKSRDVYSGFTNEEGESIISAYRGPEDAFIKDMPNLPDEGVSIQSRKVARAPRAGQIIEPTYDGFILATYGNRSSFPENGDRKAAWATDNCWNCVCYKVTVGIPEGIWELIEASEDAEQKKKDIIAAFTALMNKFLPIYARICNENVTIEPERPIIEVTAPPQINPEIIATTGIVTLNGTDTSMIASGIRIDPSRVNVQPGGKVTLTAKITPPSGQYHTIEWSTEDTDLISLTPNGETCVVNTLEDPAGDAVVKVTITSDKGEFSATANIHIELEDLVKATYDDKYAGYDDKDQQDQVAGYKKS